MKRWLATEATATGAEGRGAKEEERHHVSVSMMERARAHAKSATSRRRRVKARGEKKGEPRPMIRWVGTLGRPVELAFSLSLLLDSRSAMRRRDSGRERATSQPRRRRRQGERDG